MSRAVGPDDLQRCLPTSTLLRVCGSVRDSPRRPKRRGLAEAGATLRQICAGLRSPQDTALAPKSVTEIEPTAKPC